MERRTIKDVPVANSRIYDEVAHKNRIRKGEVEDIITFVGQYTAGVLKADNMESVQLPYFGKFKPKKSRIKVLKKIEEGQRNGKDLIYRALTGRNMTTKPNPDEIIRDRRELPGEDQQGVDPSDTGAG
jgi:nucleoid DNA-binding protein